MQNQKLIDIIHKETRTIIGTMSGMSHDSLDLALVKVSGTFPHLSIELLKSSSVSYPQTLHEKISRAKSENTAFISRLHFELGHFYGEAILEFIYQNKLSTYQIDAIGSHGQTIYHETTDGIFKNTLQICAGGIIAKKTGIITISNFREGDIALGGNGAPLVPYVDYLLYRNSTEPVSLNNLGSISNLTVITPDINQVFGFDTGPANMPIDFFAQRIHENASKIDLNGSYSSQGKIIPDMLRELMENPFLAKAPPKAAGYQEFGPDYLQIVQNKYQGHSPFDFVRTAVEFSAQSIANAYNTFVTPKQKNLKKIICTGGGARNPMLMQRIKDLLPHMTVESLTDSNSDFSDAKEALSFAVLAHEFLSGRPANIPSVTGASKATVLGQLSLP